MEKKQKEAIQGEKVMDIRNAQNKLHLSEKRKIAYRKKKDEETLEQRNQRLSKLREAYKTKKAQNAALNQPEVGPSPNFYTNITQKQSETSEKRKVAYRKKMDEETPEQKSERLSKRREAYKSKKTRQSLHCGSVSQINILAGKSKKGNVIAEKSTTNLQHSQTGTNINQLNVSYLMMNPNTRQSVTETVKFHANELNLSQVYSNSLTGSIAQSFMNTSQSNSQIDNTPTEGLSIQNLHQTNSGSISNDQHDNYSQPTENRNSLTTQPNFDNRYSTVQSFVEANIVEFYCGKLEVLCCYCDSLNFPDEKPKDGHFTFCCQKGKVRLDPLHPFPIELENLMTGKDSRHRNFMDHIRSFNSALAFASMGAKTSMPPGLGPYCFKIHGQIYHRIGTGYPQPQEVPKFAQLYFLDTSLAHEQRMNSEENRGCNSTLMMELDKWMRQWNTYAQAFMQLKEVEKKAMEEARAKGIQPASIMMALRNNKDSDPRRYNKPTVNEVAVIFEANEDGEPPLERDILIHLRSDLNAPAACSTKRLSCIDPLVDPLTYPILFPHGDPGWRINIPYYNAPGQRKFVSQAEYYQYRFAIRSNFNPLHNAGKLTQQYAVDSYCRMEASRLNYIRQNQSDLRAECYQGLVDEMNSRAERYGLLPGKAIILPSTFQGSPRNMYQNYQDAMSIVGKFGKPDIFLTMTCNPRWKEISENLQPGQKSENRPDLVARVFKLKLKELIKDITKKHIFGNVTAKIHVIEFQKRGLPHAHMVFTLANEQKLRSREAIDQIVSAEIPDPKTHPRLHRIVMKHMIHGPCGDINTSSPCMQDGVCSKGYPKVFQDCTLENLNGYPIYQRTDTGCSFQVGKHSVDNRWVVPYNPYLSLKFDCHINVEVCASIKSIKYLFKYVYKGYDCAIVEVREGDSFVNADEINNFLDARYVSPPEAMWHIFGFSMHEQSHVVVRLPVHLPKQHMVTFRPDQIRGALRNAEVKGSKLTAWFQLNETDESARELYYWEIPQHYIYEKKDSSPQSLRPEFHWRRRKIDGTKVIGRLYAVNAAQAERFSLRMLLLHVKGATSFDDLKTVNGTCYESFYDAAKEMGLMTDDEVWEKTLRDAEIAGMPKQLRQLFAFICVYGTSVDAKKLWIVHKPYLIEDFYNHQGHQDNCLACEQLALYDINETLLANGLSCKAVGLPEPPTDIPCETANALEILQDQTEGQRLVNTLTNEQKLVYDSIMSAIDSDQPCQKCFFLDGPGGSGKTYLYTTLITVLRGRQSLTIAVASTGIAADLLRNGTTAHSQFKIPIPVLENSISDIRPESSQGKIIRDAALIIWDEATMSQGLALKVVNRLCQEVMKNKNVPFGGKVLLLGGDFRQTLPVIPRGHRSVIIQHSIKKCKLWKDFKPLALKTNQRCSDLNYNEWLDMLGKGTLTNSDGFDEDIIEVPQQFICEGDLITDIFGERIDSITFARDYSNRAILCPRNENVDQINEKVLQRFEGEENKYLSVDTVDAMNDDNVLNLPTEFLNSLNPSGVPPHALKLKKGTIIMCLRNKNRKRGLLNGTKLVVKDLKPNVIHAQILSGSAKGEQVLLPRIDFAPKDHPDIPFTLKRRQFPIKLSFGMTINKSQGQTLDKVGIFLPDPVFSHGQLYTAFSRVKRASDVKVQIVDGPSQGRLLKNSTKVFTRNVVFKEIFSN